jgi:zinc D-Ala-D-Ala carboxypeptidase
MADIIGRSFEPYVKKQIAKRQEKLGLGLKNIDTLKFENTNTAFIRLTSGVNVNGEALTNLGLAGQNKYADNGLAKQFKLFSARTPNGFTSGFGYNDQSSYGFASNSDYGFVPPPGIVSMDVKAMNRGSLREANIEIKCHNLEQFQILEVLYMRLKYSILLEWGHSVYFNNSGELVQSRHDLSDTFLKGTTQTDMLKLIKQERKNSDGNYDAFFGLVTNFSWTLRPDGGYDITVTARSSGDVIESLKINTTLPVPQNTPIVTPPDPNNPPPSPPPSSIQTNYYKSTINRILTLITSQVYSPGKEYAHGVDQGSNGLYYPMHNYNIEAMAGLKASVNRDSLSAVTNATDHLTWKEILMFEFPTTLSGGTWGTRQYYMKLGTLLRIIESFLLYYDTSRSNATQTDVTGEEKELLGFSPLFEIDYNYNSNYCFTFPRHCSIDPKVCLIPIDLGEINSGTLSGPYYIETVYTYLTQDPPQEDDANQQGLNGSDLGDSYLKLVGQALYNNEFSWRDDSQLISGVLSPLPQSLPVIINNDILVTELETVFASPQSDISQVRKGYDAVKSVRSGFRLYVTPITPELNKKYIVSSDFQPQLVATVKKYSQKYGTLTVVTANGASNSITDESNVSTSSKYKTYPNNDPELIAYINNSSLLFEKQIYKKSIVVREYRNPNVNIPYNPSSALQAGSELYTQIKDTGFKDLNKPYVGNLMHTYINMEYISSTLDKNIDIKESKISLYDFLDNLMTGVQNALGNVNNFETIYDEDKNTFRIIDNTFIPGVYNSSGEDAGIVQFNANILKNNYGSFVKSVNFKTKLSNNFATMTTVGAQSNGNTVGENATALSKWNTGLTDRIITDRVNPNTSIKSGSSVADTFLQNIVNLQNFNNQVHQKYLTDNDINNLRGGITDLFKMEIGELTNQGKIPGIGFIPFDLELTMLGLSGVKIYETYTIDTTLLPKAYKDKIQFICSGVSHKVSDGEWVTTLNSICGPKYDNVKIFNPPNVKNITSVTVPKAPDEIGPDSDSGDGSNSTALTTLPPSTLLSKYITLQQAAYNSSTAKKNNIDNTPTEAAVEDLKFVLTNVYDVLYDRFNGNITLSSAYRGPALNTAVGGAENSQHKLGQAIDVEGKNGVTNKEIYFYVRNNFPSWDQLIWEYGNSNEPDWVHIAYSKSGRSTKSGKKQILSIPKGVGPA